MLRLFFAFIFCVFSSKSIAVEPSAQNVPEIMIVGAKYDQPSYKQATEGTYFLVDSKDGGDIKHDITQAFPRQYHNYFNIVIFEQLPYFAINKMSIQNALSVLKSGGTLSMNCPYSLEKTNRNFGREEDYTLNDGRKVWLIDASFYIQDEELPEKKCISYKENDHFNVAQELINKHFESKFSINFAQLVGYSESSHKGRIWIKNQYPSPPPSYLVLIEKP